MHSYKLHLLFTHHHNFYSTQQAAKCTFNQHIHISTSPNRVSKVKMTMHLYARQIVCIIILPPGRGREEVSGTTSPASGWTEWSLFHANSFNNEFAVHVAVNQHVC